ncbi:phosphoribosylanthranilate isomerase [Nitratifractor sp.]|uniref:phosphoribosylanthranilate isomerase n=1 Tax=Nitratifractor sp. TaxID=2268144 RepID=UPI0025ED1632|nr:phosphoribosylanthranilate isomerase [Nitratifractor sp.]
MRVKICGITSYDDAMLAIEAGVDALGFVFYPGSPRYIAPEAARKIINRLPPFVEKVGLFVEETPERITELSRQSGITLAQIHFDVDESFLEEVDFPTLPVIRAKGPEDLERFADRYRLVDAYCESYGGSGKRLALEWFAGRDNSRIIIAGGLTPENVLELAGYGFYGCDVSSGTEAAKGIKDPVKVRDFIRHAQSL